MAIDVNRRTLLSAAVVLVSSSNSLADDRYARFSPAKIENSLLETYGGKIKFQKNFPIITKTGTNNALYLNRIFPPGDLKKLDSISARLVIRKTNGWDIIHESTIYFEKIRGYVLRKNFTCNESMITASLFFANIEYNTKKVIL